MLINVYGDSERFKEVYWKKFENQGYYFAGDGAVKDKNGYITILGRVDDVINVSGHRLSTMELESTLVAHSDVAEAAVVGYEHPIKGEAIAAFITPNKSIDEMQLLSIYLNIISLKKSAPLLNPMSLSLLRSCPRLVRERL